MALADPSRWAIVRLLEGRARSVGEVASEVGLSLAVVSRHLQRLRGAGIVTAHRDGKNLVCSLASRESTGGRWLAEMAPAVRRKAAPVRRDAPEARRPTRLESPRGETQAPLPRRELDDYLL